MILDKVSSPLVPFNSSSCPSEVERFITASVSIIDAIYLSSVSASSEPAPRVAPVTRFIDD